MFENQRQEEVKALLDRDAEFHRLYSRHKELDKAVQDAELGVRPVDDLALASMKKEKLKAKDRLTDIWEHRSSA